MFYCCSGTPPSLSISTLNREFDADLPLGPLSPSPLSPSILTVCTNGLQAFDLRGGGGSAENSGDLNAPRAAHDLWTNSSFSNLPDMRECSSPYLVSCASPGGLPSEG